MLFRSVYCDIREKGQGLQLGHNVRVFLPSHGIVALTRRRLQDYTGYRNDGRRASLLRLGDGRLCLSYGRRAVPYGILARLSGDQGKTWGQPIVLRDDGAAADVGYVRSIIRPDSKIVAVYYYNDRSSPERYLAATVWDPGKP